MASNYVFAFLFLLAWFPDHNNCQRQSFTMRISPELAVAGIETETVNVSCLPDIGQLGVTKPLSLSIIHDFKSPLVTVSNETGLTYTKNAPSNYQAKGTFDSRAGNVALTLTIKSPRMQDGGIYSCVLVYLDPVGVLSDVRVTNRLQVTENNSSYKEANEMFLTRISELERIVERQEAILSKLFDVVMNALRQPQLTRLALRVDDLDGKVNGTIQQSLDGLDAVDKTRRKKVEETAATVQGTVKTRLTHLQKERVAQRDVIHQMETTLNDATSNRLPKLEASVVEKLHSIQQLRDRETKTPFFSACFDEVYNTVPNLKTVVFPRVLASHGGGYDKTTGIFKAPVPGTYAFKLTMQPFCPDCQSKMAAVLFVGKTVTAMLSAYDERYSTPSTVYTIVTLKKGERVRVIPRIWDKRNSVYGPENSKFEGYLIT